uniref:hypothetical protein n=1 Tax=Mycolicibacterium iranicum TaxID=912594 RepID=UPI003F584B1B
MGDVDSGARGRGQVVGQLRPVGVVADVRVDGVDEGVVAVGGGISADEFGGALFEWPAPRF